jgi:hypothetical protein
MSDEDIRSVRQRKQALDSELNAAISKDLNDFIKRSDENFKRMREGNRQHWVQMAEKKITLAEADSKRGDRISAMTHSMAAENYLSFANMA